MIKKVDCLNRTIEDFINREQYESLVIEEIMWRINKDSICEPIVIARLARIQPVAIAQSKSIFEIEYISPGESKNIKPLKSILYLN